MNSGVSKSKMGPKDVLHFRGSLGESMRSDLESLLKECGGDIVIDLTDLSHVDSRGVKLWMEAIVPWALGKKINVYNCPREAVDTFNMFPDLVKGMRFSRAHIPGYCDSCSDFFDVEVSPNAGVLRAADFENAKNAECPKCGDSLHIEPEYTSPSFMQG